MSSDKKSAAEEKVSAKSTSNSEKPVRRSFPGPREATALLRVAVARNAYAELIVHAKESLDAEVCGVLAGQVCEDEQGLFVSVEAAIRGTSANQGSTHVTFTQATWNSIHKTLERDYPNLKMVGWYHTHPGFGVEFSDMDLFIQKNFFSGPTQIALVTDPLSGAVAICANRPEGPQYLDQFWVDGREQACKKPAAKPTPEKAGATPADPAGGSDSMTAIRALESRVSQLVQVIDDQRATFYRFLLSIGMLVCVALLIAVYFFIHNMYVDRNEPPKNVALLPEPIQFQIDGKPILLGLQIVQWQVPPELNSMMLQMEKERLTELAKEATNTVSTNVPTAQSSAQETNGTK